MAGKQLRREKTQVKFERLKKEPVIKRQERKEKRERVRGREGAPFPPPVFFFSKKKKKHTKTIRTCSPYRTRNSPGSQ